MKRVGRFEVPMKAIQTETTDGSLFLEIAKNDVIMKMMNEMR